MKLLPNDRFNCAAQETAGKSLNLSANAIAYCRQSAKDGSRLSEGSALDFDAVITMKKWMILLVGIVATTLLCLVASVFWEPPEPAYEGKKLSKWLSDTVYYYSDKHLVAQKAIRQIGTNAIPILLKMLQAHDSALMVKMDDLAERVSLKVHTPAQIKILEAEGGFEALGPLGKEAVPALIALFTNGPSIEARRASARILGMIGPDARTAVPTLLMAVTNANQPPSPWAMLALGEIHAEPEVVVPAILKFINSTNRFVQLSALSSLSSMGPDARPAFSVILAEATNPASALRVRAIFVLGKMRAEPETVMPILTNLLGDSNAGLRSSAADALGYFGPEAKSAVPLLVELLKDTNRSVSFSAGDALKKIDPDAAHQNGIK